MSKVHIQKKNILHNELYFASLKIFKHIPNYFFSFLQKSNFIYIQGSMLLIYQESKQTILGCSFNYG